MAAAFVALSAVEHDALTELVNIGVSRSAAGLRQMVGEEVLLSVPSVDVGQSSRCSRGVDRRAREGGDLVAVRQDFSGAFAGRALLIFPQANSLELVRALVVSDAAVARGRAGRQW